MRGLGNPVHVCSNHVAALHCDKGCLGVVLDGLAELKSVTHDGCAVCESAANMRPLRTLRKCHHLGCYGRFHPVSVDELNLGEWLAFYRQRLGRAVGLVFRR